MNSVLREGSLRGESQRLHDQIMASAETWEARNKEADQIANPDVRARTKQLLDDGFAREKRYAQAQKDENFMGAASEAEKALDVKAVPPHVWISLSPQERTTIEERIQRLKSGAEPTTDSKVWTELNYMPPAKLAALTEADLMRVYRPKLDDSHYDAALRMVRSTKEAMANNDTSFFSAMITDRDIVTNGYLAYADEVSVKELNERQQGELMRFSGAAATAVQKYEQAKGKKATDEEKQKIVGDLLKNKVFVEKSFGFQRHPASRLNATLGVRTRTDERQVERS